MQLATLAGGCFWCLEPVFTELKGVHRVVSGYAGGAVDNPSYRQVCTGTTGHAEVVQIEFDPEMISYRTLLDIFFAVHNPTTLNRQGADTGTQYRSAVFYHSPEQKAEAQQAIRELDAAHIWDQPVVTSLEPLVVFYPAEDYHQSYYALNPEQRYCQVVIEPKLAKLRSHYLDRLKR
jgi:peptide-methionine (S)-S-oxide reductase